MCLLALFTFPATSFIGFDCLLALRTKAPAIDNDMHAFSPMRLYLTRPQLSAFLSGIDDAMQS
jgi:hypothetical protein